MFRPLFVLLLLAAVIFAQAFEVATIKPTPPEWNGGRFIRMQGPQRLQATNYSVRHLVAVAYSLPITAVSGGPGWIDSDRYDIVAVTPGPVRPNLDEQMAMIRALLTDRFQLAYHREAKEAPIYVLTVARNGPKLRETEASPDEDPVLVNQVYPDHISLPARNATLGQFATMMQRVVLDRPVVDRTGLAGRYDFDLEWTPDDTQFGGQGPRPPADAAKPSLYAAIQEQVGLRLEATRGPIQALLIDRVERPSEN